ncbi:MAG: rhodanese-like domain-containing protein [Pseudomonadota bacterium]|nr:rhodanese-like domain-containing protein [Pseudomonadota bacterium]
MKRLLRWLPLGHVREVAATELWQRRHQVQLVDVRSQREYRHSHIPQALHLPITRFSHERIRALQLDPQRPVVTICLSAHRSIPATRQLQAMGFQAAQLQGGMLAWWKAGLPCTEAP